MNQKLLLLIVCLVITVDQATKSLAREFDSVQINPGIAFGLLSGGGGSGVGGGESSVGAAGRQAQLWLSSIFGVLFIVLLFAYLYADRLAAIGFGLFLGGAFSNGIDRVVWGGVQDWIPLPLVSLQNNLADVAIAIGVLVLIYAAYEKYGLSRSL